MVGEEIIMDAATWGFIGTLVGAVVGASASILTTVISGRNSAYLQKNTDTLERVERARSFQRSNLIELQDSLLDAMRFIGRAYVEDTMASKKNGEWGKSLLSKEVNQGILLSTRKLAILTERVSNDELRSDLKGLRQLMAQCLGASSESESVDLMQKVTSKFESFMEHLGIVLRSNY